MEIRSERNICNSRTPKHIQHIRRSIISKFLKFNTRLFAAGTKGRHLTISISTRILVEKIKFITGSRLTPTMCIRVAIPCPLGRENIRDRSVYTVFTRAHRGKQRWNNGVGRFDTHPSDVNSLALGRHLTSPRIFHHYSLPFPSSPILLYPCYPGSIHPSTKRIRDNGIHRFPLDILSTTVIALFEDSLVGPSRRAIN